MLVSKLKNKRKRPRNESGSDNNENEWLEDREKERKMLKVINAREVEKPSHAAAINKFKNHWLCLWSLSYEDRVCISM